VEASNLPASVGKTGS